MHWQTQKVSTSGYQVQTYSCGEGSTEILLIHGGPGAPSDYLQDSHVFLAAQGYKVVTWDQLGCGRSDKPDNPSLWKIDRFVDELEQVRVAMNLKKPHLLGTSWGGMLAIEYALHYPLKFSTLTLVNASPSISLLKERFTEYKRGVDEKSLLSTYLCRVDKWPKSLTYSLENLSKPVLNTLFGPSLFEIEGNLQGWERMRDLCQIAQPTLIVGGEHYCKSIAMQTQKHLPHSRFEIIKGASRTPFIETPAQYQQALYAFLKEH